MRRQPRVQSDPPSLSNPAVRETLLRMSAALRASEKHQALATQFEDALKRNDSEMMLAVIEQVNPIDLESLPDAIEATRFVRWP